MYASNIPVTLNSFRILLTKSCNPLTSCAVLAVEHMSHEDCIQEWKNFSCTSQNHNAEIHSCMIVRNEWVEFIGEKNDSALSKTSEEPFHIIDLHNLMVLPCYIDGHMHLSHASFTLRKRTPEDGSGLLQNPRRHQTRNPKRSTSRPSRGSHSLSRLDAIDDGGLSSCQHAR